MFLQQIPENCIKFGKSNSGVQRYKCLETNRVIQAETTRCSIEYKLNIVFLYYKGMSLRKLGQIYNVSHQSVKNWVDQISQVITDNFKLSDNQEIKDIKSLEIDELYTYFVKKKLKHTF